MNTETATVSGERQFCSFFLGDSYYGIDVDKVRETVRNLRITPVPLTAPEISGIVNLRGDIVTAIDLRKRLGRGDTAAPGPAAVQLIAETSDGIVSLVVDAVGDVLTVSQDRFEPPPPTLSGDVQRFVQGTYKLEGRLLLVLDVEAVADI